MKVTKTMYTETAHRLHGHPGRCRFLHGHSYNWQVTLEGDHLANGMLLDFSDLKRIMTQIIDPFDHAVVLQAGNEFDEDLIAIFIAHGMSDRVIEVPYRPTAENMSEVVRDQLQQQYPDFKVTVRLYETTTSFAEVG
jgi:6-pyruvoyltetrahydropterin/6-carboxytetrahydropterin synthase